MVYKNEQNSTFEQLDKIKQEAIKLLFEDSLSDELIAKSVNRSRQTLAKWKNDPVFQQAQLEYRRRYTDDKVPSLITRLYELAMNSESEKVSLQAIKTMLSMSGYDKADIDNRLNEAKITKAEAEAQIMQYTASKLTNDINTNEYLKALYDVINGEENGE